MTVVLAATWDPRGEENRFQRLLPVLQRLYGTLVVTLPPEPAPALLARIRDWPVQFAVTRAWTEGRHRALDMALATGADAIHYADLDRLLRWAETRCDELERAVAAVQTADCLLIGRTERAFATHPRSMQASERVLNRVFSHLLGQPVDLPSGSKGFSRRVAEYLVRCASPDSGLATDAQWAVLAYQAGIPITTLWVDGLDWETADRYRDRAADAETQRRAADAYDANPASWAYRIQLTDQIIEAGLALLAQPPA